MRSPTKKKQTSLFLQWGSSKNWSTSIFQRPVGNMQGSFGQKFSTTEENFTLTEYPVT